MTAIRLLNSLGFRNIQTRQIPSNRKGFEITNITGRYSANIFADFRYSKSIRYYRLANANGKPYVWEGKKYKYPLNLTEFEEYFNEVVSAV